MCGRYRLSRRKQIIEEHFDSISGEEDWTPRYNIAPTQPVPVIRQNPQEFAKRHNISRASVCRLMKEANDDCNLAIAISSGEAELEARL
jgi:putative SOS response-associated peptidase YedK